MAEGGTSKVAAETIKLMSFDQMQAFVKTLEGHYNNNCYVYARYGVCNSDSDSDERYDGFDTNLEDFPADECIQKIECRIMICESTFRPGGNRTIFNIAAGDFGNDYSACFDTLSTYFPKSVAVLKSAKITISIASQKNLLGQLDLGGKKDQDSKNDVYSAYTADDSVSRGTEGYVKMVPLKVFLSSFARDLKNLHKTQNSDKIRTKIDSWVDKTSEGENALYNDIFYPLVCEPGILKRFQQESEMNAQRPETRNEQSGANILGGPQTGLDNNSHERGI